jgi:hypothetical protein
MPDDIVADLLADCEAKLTLLAAAHAREMAHPIGRRRRSLLVFLERERAVYTFGADLLRQVTAARDAAPATVRG